MREKQNKNTHDASFPFVEKFTMSTNQKNKVTRDIWLFRKSDGSERASERVRDLDSDF